MPITTISQHLQLPEKWQKKLKPCQTICAFTGAPITKGVPLKDLISSNFTDHQYLKYNSDFAGESAVKCMVPVFKKSKEVEKNGETITKEFWNSLRTYSFYANNEELQLLNKEQLLPILLSPPTPPFVLCISYINKKHLSYKAVLNESTDSFIVRTDNEEVKIDPAQLKELSDIMKRWYSVIPEKAGLANPPTWFTKSDIWTGKPRHNNIMAYGLEKFFAENEILDNYRQTSLFRLVHFSLTKTHYVKA